MMKKSGIWLPVLVPSLESNAARDQKGSTCQASFLLNISSSRVATPPVGHSRCHASGFHNVGCRSPTSCFSLPCSRHTQPCSSAGPVSFVWCWLSAQHTGCVEGTAPHKGRRFSLKTVLTTRLRLSGFKPWTLHSLTRNFEHGFSKPRFTHL